ncbi:Prolow-density lipoprotein receptor-related protein 1 [Holothuria leucospilota]|uniref:Prolow-density lipoprotein receptor-related protein 1 n=1 Tax=Holothuria leucospilota TaxID=206669 RepID=A0A9Q1HL27_HOLLE|nr:Prolow-density lipoprotein receptor-related protein 1 [Holothuria leucospilota]
MPTCAPNYFHFHCTSTYYCIPWSWTCDGDNDCVNGSDEADCGTQLWNTNCLLDVGKDFSTAKNGDCIHDAWKCDREDDCGDNSDEDISLCPGRF